MLTAIGRTIPDSRQAEYREFALEFGRLCSPLQHLLNYFRWPVVDAAILKAKFGNAHDRTIPGFNGIMPSRSNHGMPLRFDPPQLMRL